MSILQILFLILMTLTIVLILMRIFGQSPTFDQITVSAIATLYTAIFDLYYKLGKQEEHNKWAREKLENIEKLLQEKKA